MAAKFGLVTTAYGPTYYEQQDASGSGIVLHTGTWGTGAGQTTCISPGVGSLSQMQFRTDLLQVPAAQFLTTDPGYSRILWTPNSGATAWRPLNGSAMLAGAVSKISNPLQSITGTGTFSAHPAILANLLQPGYNLRFRMMLRKTGTAGATTLNMYFGTAGTTSDATIYTLNIAASNNRDIRVDTNCFVFDSGTITAQGASQINVDEVQMAAPATTNINTAAQMFLTVAVTATSPDAMALISYGMFIEAP